jgi:hypothetical protein
MPGGNLAVYDIEEIVKVRRETDRRHTCGLPTCMLLLCVGRASRMLVDPSRERERLALPQADWAAATEALTIAYCDS